MIKEKNEAYIQAFAERVRQLRDEKGWSQYKLAEVSGIHRSSIKRIESADVNTTISTLLALAKAFEISPSELVDFPFKEEAW